MKIIYNMEDYFRSIVEDYEELSSQLLGKEVTLKPVATPFLEDDHKSSPARAPAPYTSSTPMCPWCKVPCDTTVDDVVEFERERQKLIPKKVKKPKSHSPVGALPGAADWGGRTRF